MKKLVNRKLVVFSMLIGMLVMVTSSVYAQLNIKNIDTFNADTQTHLIPTGIGPVAPVCGTPLTGGTDMMGSVRDISLERVAGNGAILADVNTTVSGAFAYSVNASTTGKVIVQWDGTPGCTINPTGLSGQVLNPNDGLFIKILSTDQGTTVKMRIYTAVGQYSEFLYTVPYSVDLPGYLAFFPFDKFTPVGGGADYGNVGAIEIEITGTNLDMSVDIVASDFARDYGDLPAAYLNTTVNSLPGDVGDNGARHILGAIYLGSTIDSEVNGQESANAGANTDGDYQRSDDENGITFGVDNKWGDGTGQIQVNITKPATVNAGCVVGFIDWDNSDSFDANNPTGLASEIVLKGGGLFTSQSVNIITPTVADYGVAYPAKLNSRFRIFAPNDPIFAASNINVDFFGCPTSNFGGASNIEANLIKLVYGDALDGEVEDYQWGFTPTAVNLQSFSADNTSTLPIVGVAVLAVLALVSAGIFIVRREEKQA